MHRFGCAEKHRLIWYIQREQIDRVAVSTDPKWASKLEDKVSDLLGQIWRA
jgi:hypothetical protein